MTLWMWVQRSLPLLPMLPAITILVLVMFRTRDGQAGLGSWTRLQLAGLVMGSFCALKVATIVASYGITVYGLGE